MHGPKRFSKFGKSFSKFGRDFSNLENEFPNLENDFPYLEGIFQIWKIVFHISKIVSNRIKSIWMTPFFGGILFLLFFHNILYIMVMIMIIEKISSTFLIV